ncbi:hypothetical protein L4D18_09980 [Vibrio campbellii]|uniref:hypothetical protein n=1 Tax=Vibrio campbellii TaxID=680 RepID=UPI003D14F235
MISEAKAISEIKENKNIILNSLSYINNKFIEINESMLLEKSCNTKDLKRVKVKIGFPFTVDEYYLPIDKDLSFCNGYTLIFRGRLIREVQHKNYIKHQLGSQMTYSLVSEVDIDRYRENLKNSIKNVHRILYIDPHNQDNGTNIGDSFISLYYPKIYLEHFSANSIDIYTRSKRHLENTDNLFFHEYGNLEKVNLSNYDLVVISDFIDVNHIDTCELLDRFKLSNEYNVILNGRNSYFIKKGSKLTHYKYSKEDPILTNKGIEDYMMDCSSPFVNNNDNILNPDVKFIKTNSNTIFINPFTSKVERDLYPRIVKKIIDDLSDINPELSFIISPGLRNKKELEWMCEFKNICQRNNVTTMPAFENLIDIINFIRENDAICISADTSITHLCIEHKRPCITIYGMKYFNFNSPQSIAEIFTRKNPYLIPLSLYENRNSEENVTKSVINIINILSCNHNETFEFEVYKELKSELLRNINYLELSKDNSQFNESKKALKITVNNILMILPPSIRLVYEQFDCFEITKDINDKISSKNLISYILKCSILLKIGAMI